MIPRPCGTGVKALVGGDTAAGIDLGQPVSTAAAGHRRGDRALFLLLMAVFRSVAIPLKAAIMNLLSIGAAYGVIVAVFQWGWLGRSSASARPGRSIRGSR